MAVQHTEGGTLITGEHTQVARWITLKVGVKHERPGGLRLTRGLSMKTRACDALGIPRSTKREKVIELLEAKICAVAVVADAAEAATK